MSAAERSERPTIPVPAAIRSPDEILRISLYALLRRIAAGVKSGHISASDVRWLCNALGACALPSGMLK